MDLRQQIKIATIHGGSWLHLNKRLIADGSSQEFADEYTSFMRSQLGEEHSEHCLIIYDLWKKEDEHAALSILTLIAT